MTETARGPDRMAHRLTPCPGEYWTLNATIRRESRRRGFFAAPGHYLKDHTWIAHGGRWHVFYIRGAAVGAFTGTRDVDVGHASTADFIRWKGHRPVPMNGAPTIIRRGRLFHLYANQKAGDSRALGICLATSPDLERWTVHPKYPVYTPNPELYGRPGVMHCRDYHAMPFEDGYLMLFAELTRDGVGCVGAIRSRNLVDWEDIGPIFKVDKPGWGYTQWDIVGYGIPESPFLMQKDGRWHLWFTDNLVNRTYRLWSDRPLDGWTWDRGAFFHGSPLGWDWAAEPAGVPAAAAGSAAACEVFETTCGWVVSYYFFDPVEARSVLRVEPLVWHDGHPFIRPNWPALPRTARKGDRAAHEHRS